MGFFDRLFNGSDDPMRSAQIRGGMLGAARSLLQPYSGFGDALTGAGYGALQGKQDYTQDQFTNLKLQEMKDQAAQSAARKAALNNLFLGTQSATPNALATPTMRAPQQQPQDGGFGPDYSAPGQTVPAIPPQQQKIPGFNSAEEAQQYLAIAGPDAFIKRAFPEHKLTGYSAGQHVYDETGREAFAVPDKPTPNQPFNPDGSPNLTFQKYEKGKIATQQGPAWANVEIAREKATNGFTADEGNLMGALAERGVSLPAGMRSLAQQKALYKGILERNPTKTPDEIADLIKKGSIELGAQKKETQTAAAVAGRVEVAQNEIEEFVPLVREAAAKVNRGNFVPLNRLMQMADTSISDPNLKVLKGRINAVLNAYDMLASRGGTDVEKRAEVRNLLTSADGPEALNAQLDSFLTEAAAAHRAAVKATKVPELSSSDAAPPKISPSDLPANAKMQLKAGTVTTFKNGSKWTLQNGKPVQVQ